MYQTYNFGVIHTSFIEFLVAGVLFLFFAFWAFYYQTLKVKNNPEFKLFTAAIIVKMLGSFLYYGIYAHYYSGGDTTHYFEMILIYREIFLGNPGDFIEVFFSTPSREHYNIFWNHQIWPFEETYFVPTLMTPIKFATPLGILANGSFLLTTMFMGIISFFAVWALYKSFLKVCPDYRYNFVACFLIPSSIFWAGGISKDTVTLIGVCLFISNAIMLSYISKEKRPWTIIKILGAVLLIIGAKPYVLIALFPSFILWKFSNTVKKTFSQAWLRVFILSFTSIIAIGLSFFVLSLLGESMEKFAVNNALETAVVYNRDLQSDYHHGQSFNIGTFEPTIASVVSKIPIAGFAGIFYPLPGQVAGLVPNVSTIEGVFYIAVIFWILFNRFLLGINYSVPIEKKETLNFFLMFAVMFCIMLGLSTSNFGALVRFRTPALPFLSGYFLIQLYYIRNRQIKK